ncbi:hypothetical protein TVAG_342860 [Trichomonas vaginalis G3]|uniref:Uncharacterized protein n=1 Tax=Trichomonas vaginalis (strain ATCC PRA-98 / G3) TaxID=412133 RepID=A2EJP8_TRIV3|nr:H/ACA ribonucleoprotein complex non-core subunit NAF1 family [Trichomonas vaginalis G3]EAY07122.1 hypothetical protein TVAG_342860 [Trichomonas vaginalis G3]KAI5522477.1 H/ACA ribonucleoprotein complex non-core subunit NAF1 family [Trichomonas vaginalis G3]|eukprot:XP_001319345.1 hypothetical protein [Trichomonas vaginalis G3]
MNGEQKSDLWEAYHSLMDEEEEKNEEPQPQVRVSANAFKIVEMYVSSSDSDDEQLETKYTDNDPDSNKPIRSVHEIPTHELPPGEVPENIPENWKLLPACRISNKVGNLCTADLLGKPLEPGSLLLTQDRKPTTRVLELFGQIENPKLIINGDYPVGTVLYTVVEDSSVPDPELIARKYKGTDASNKFDEAVEKPSDDDDIYGNEDDDEDEHVY